MDSYFALVKIYRSDRKTLNSSDAWSGFVLQTSQDYSSPHIVGKNDKTGVHDDPCMHKFAIRIRNTDAGRHVAFTVNCL